MAIDLEKSVKEVGIVLEKIGFNEKVQVVLALDISGSMHESFANGSVQELVERLLAIGINMDQNQEIDVYLFGANAHHAEAATRSNIDGFVRREITNKFNLESTTLYSPVMKMIAGDFDHTASATSPKKGLMGRLFGSKQAEPESTGEDTVVVFFITDGENFDTGEAEAFIKEISKKPVFWQFVGIGGSSFRFLEKLDDMGGRHIDNANFFDAGDISSISDNVLYSRILSELPSWHKEAVSKGVIK